MPSLLFAEKVREFYFPLVEDAFTKSVYPVLIRMKAQFLLPFLKEVIKYFQLGKIIFYCCQLFISSTII